MALGFLKIIFAILILMALIGQILLYSNRWSQVGLIWNISVTKKWFTTMKNWRAYGK